MSRAIPGDGPVLLLGALDAEVETVGGHLMHTREVAWRGYRLLEGRLRGRAVVVTRSGVGKSLAAMLTQHLVDRYAPAAIIFTGVAGALNPQLEVGDTVVAETCMQHDMDATALGFARGEIPYTPHRVLTCDPGLVARALTCTPSTGRVLPGHVLTGDVFITASRRESLRYLREELGGDAVEMEGASAGLVAVVNEVPFVLVRTISDRADTAASIDFAAFVKQASATAWEFADHLLS